MNVGTICTRDPVVVDATDSLRQAAMLMREHHVGSLVVVQRTERGREAVGVVTDRDLVIEAMANGVDADTVAVADLCGDVIASIPSSAELDEAVDALREFGVRRLLVTTPEGRVAGIVSSDDLLQTYAVELDDLAGALGAGLLRETLERAAPAAPAIPEIVIASGAVKEARTS